MVKVYISAAGMIPFGRHTKSILTMVREALDNLNRSRVTPEMAVEALFCGSMNPEQFIGQGNISTAIADRLGLSPAPAVRVETASSTGAAALHMGVMAVASGMYDNVLVIGAEKMTGLDTAAATEALSSVLSAEERRYGATMPALGAMVTRVYMHEHGLTREILSKVAVKAHHNGSLNPYAHFRKEITLEMASTARFVSEPLRLYDCSPMSDGAAAIMLCSKKTDIMVAGIGQATDRLEVRSRSSLTSFESTRQAAKRAFNQSKLAPADIDIAELHDAFTTFELISAEDVGFYEPGGAVSATSNGETALNGNLPINTSGGLKAKGHPVGVSGLAQVIELVWQIRGEAARRQVDGVRTGLAQSTGGLANNNLVTIIKMTQ